MTGASSEEALDAFLDQLRRIAACITTRPLRASGYRTQASPHQISFAPFHEPVRLRTPDRQRVIQLAVRLMYVVAQAEHRTGTHDVSIVSYFYEILDADQHEIIAYHWHPIGASRVTYPHLHLSNQLSPIALARVREPLSLADLHIATGLAKFADVVQMLVEEFGIQPLVQDWRRIVDLDQLG